VVKSDDEKLDAEKRAARMTELANRIGRTESGSRFLDRIYEISKPRPLHEEREQDEGE
jgi:hypothetical protein